MSRAIDEACENEDAEADRPGAGEADLDWDVEDNDDEDDGSDNDCGLCGGSGGAGPELRCISCGGSGRRRSAGYDDRDYDSENDDRAERRDEFERERRAEESRA
jgi:hypothetical protein